MDKFWTFKRNNKAHTITCTVDESGRLHITADGRTVKPTQKLSTHGMQYTFILNRHQCAVYQRNDADRTRLVLTVDGQKVSSGRRAQKTEITFSNADQAAVFARRQQGAAHRAALRHRLSESLPELSWFFAGTLVFIPILGEFWGLTFFLMMVGLGGVILVASASQLRMAQRVFLAWFITIAVWAVYLIMAMNATLPCLVL
jgi:hypothetical protein